MFRAKNPVSFFFSVSAKKMLGEKIWVELTHGGVTIHISKFAFDLRGVTYARVKKNVRVIPQYENERTLTLSSGQEGNIHVFVENGDEVETLLTLICDGDVTEATMRDTTKEEYTPAPNHILTHDPTSPFTPYCEFHATITGEVDTTNMGRLSSYETFPEIILPLKSGGRILCSSESKDLSLSYDSNNNPGVSLFYKEKERLYMTLGQFHTQSVDTLFSVTVEN